MQALRIAVEDDQEEKAGAAVAIELYARCLYRRALYGIDDIFV